MTKGPSIDIYSILLGCMLLLLAIPNYGQSSSGESDSIAVKYIGSLEEGPSADDDETKWLVLPVLWYTPETRLAFGASGLYYFQADPGRSETSISSLNALFLYSLNNQLISEVNGTIFRSNDELQLRFTLGYYRYPNSYFGLGNNTLEGNEERYTNAYPYARIRLKQEVTNNIFLGIRTAFEYNKFLDLEEGGLLENGVYGVDGGLNWGLGFSASFDNRDNQYFSYEGLFAEFSMMTHSDKLGSDYNYLNITADLRQFIPLRLSENPHILGFQLYGQFQTGEAPFHRLGLMGGPEQMRGYFQGRYRDRQYLAFQTEYRFPIWRMFRGVAFGTAGEVAPSFDGFNLSELKYSAGAGLRIQLVPEDRIYIRFDYGYAFDGKGGFYFQFNEAF